MKVILVRDVPKLGHKYEVKEVSDGYGRNFLIARGLARVATQKAEEEVARLRTQLLANKEVQHTLLKKDFATLTGTEITLSREANEEGHLFAGIHEADIVEVLAKKTGVRLKPEHIVLSKPIKTIGVHSIPIRVGEDSAEVTLTVTSLG